MSDYLRITERIEVCHVEGERAVCLWVAVYETAHRIYVYRELAAEGLGDTAFALRVQRATPESEEIGCGWCYPSAWLDGGPARAWRDAGLYCRSVRGDVDSWGRLKDFLEPVELLGRNGWERAPRLQILRECHGANAALHDLAWQQDGTPVGDTLYARALLLACLAQPPDMALHRDPEEEREALRMERMRREFPDAYRR